MPVIISFFVGVQRFLSKLIQTYLQNHLRFRFEFNQCGVYFSQFKSPMASQITSVSFVCLTVCSSADKKHQSSASLAFMKGIHRWTVDSPHKRPVTRKMFPFDDVIMNPVNDTSAIRHVTWDEGHWVLSYGGFMLHEVILWFSQPHIRVNVFWLKFLSVMRMGIVVLNVVASECLLDAKSLETYDLWHK